jgi:hypothetical protein
MSSLPEPREPNRRRFSKEEDEKLRRLIRQYGTRDWATVSSCLSDRTARQCRHRYRNYLMDGRQRTAWTPAEDQMIITKFREFGPKWVRIATFLPRKSGNDVKNRWHKHILRYYSVDDAIIAHDSPEESPDSERGIEPPPLAFDFVAGRGIGATAKGGLSAFLQLVLN